MVVQDQTEMFLNLNHHPVCAASDASHFLLTGAATPPGQEGQWIASRLLHLSNEISRSETELLWLDSTRTSVPRS